MFQTLYDTGAIGLAFLIAAVAVLLRALWRMDRSIWAVRLLGAFVALAISYEDTTALWFSCTWLVGMLGLLTVDARYSIDDYKDACGADVGQKPFAVDIPDRGGLTP